MLHWDVAFSGLWEAFKLDFSISPWSILIIIAWITIAVIWSKGTNSSVVGSMFKLLFLLILLAIIYNISQVVFYIIIGLTVAITLYCALN